MAARMTSMKSELRSTFSGQEKNKVLPMLGVKERQSTMKFAPQVEEKGPHQYAIQAVVEDIESLGIKRSIFKSDQEPAITSLKETLGKKYELIPEESLVEDHQANGEIENAIKELEKQIRIIKLALE